MNFANPVQRTTYERVRQFMPQLYGDEVVAHDEEPIFLLTGGSALITVGVEAWTDDAAVHVLSYLVTEIDPSEELFEFLLLANGELSVAGFGIDADGDVFYKQTLLGSTLDKKELDQAVGIVLWVADQYDDQIISRFGGLDARARMSRAGF